MRANGSYAIATSIGAIRNDNQDAALFVRVRYARQRARDFNIAIVCDGMGGLRFGKEAAALGTAHFVALLLDTQRTDDVALRRAIIETDRELYERFRAQGGTTLSAVVMRREGVATAVHAGDSRIYEITPDREVTPVSRDDNLRSALNPDQDFDPDLGSKLIQFVGMGEGLEPHIFQMSHSAKSVLLTSDGVHSVDKMTFRRVVKAAPSASELARRLLLLADVVGGVDNATAMIAPVTLPDDNPPISGRTIFIAASNDSIEIWQPESQESNDGGRRPANDVKAPRKGGNSPAKKKRPPKTASKSKGTEVELDFETRPIVSVEFPDRGD